MLNPVFQSIVTTMTGMPPATPEQLYRLAMRQHDWSHEFSDEHRVWKAGRESLAKITEMQKDIDPDGEIWNQHAPVGYRIGRTAEHPAIAAAIKEVM